MQGTMPYFGYFAIKNGVFIKRVLGDSILSVAGLGLVEVMFCFRVTVAEPVQAAKCPRGNGCFPFYTVCWKNRMSFFYI